MEFAFDHTLTQLRERGRDIGRTRVEPTVAARDRTATWDAAIFSGLAKAGLAGVLLPAGKGGLGLTVLQAVAFLEGFGEGGGDAGLALAIGVHGLLCGVPVATLGTRAQRDRYLADIAECQRQLREGESYEICLTTTARLPLAGDPLAVYRRLRRANPAPHAA